MRTHGMDSAPIREPAGEGEEKYRNLLENISDWVWETDINMVFTYTNPRVKDYLGYAPEEITGRSMYDLMSPFWVDRIKGLLDSMDRAGQPVAVAEKMLISRSGEPVEFEMTVNLVFSKDGTLKGYRGICRDIRDRKRAEEAQRKAFDELEHRVEKRTGELESARATLQAILDTVPIGIIVVDARTNSVTYHSAGVEKVFGGPLVGKKYGIDMYPDQIFHQNGQPIKNEEMPLYISLHSGMQVADMEIKVRRPNGEERTVLVNSAPIRDAYGHIVSAVAAIVDISRLKAVEQELQEAKSQAEMYLDLMGHDINNLNQVGIGYLETALGRLASLKKLDAGDRPLLEKALETQVSSSTLIDNVRKIQKSRAGGLRYKPIDLCNILASLKEHYSHIPGRDVAITLAADPQCYVYANELIGDVFVNLIGNAIKHSPPGRPLEIGIRLAAEARDGEDFYRISIEDNGPGIPDDLKGQLFTRFERGKVKARGRGVGLYLVRTLLEDMGGTISAEDRVPGDHTKGSRFVVLLPAIPGDKG